jgi:hypothetical protein
MLKLTVAPLSCCLSVHARGRSPSRHICGKSYAQWGNLMSHIPTQAMRHLNVTSVVKDFQRMYIWSVTCARLCAEQLGKG